MSTTNLKLICSCSPVYSHLLHNHTIHLCCKLFPWECLCYLHDQVYFRRNRHDQDHNKDICDACSHGADTQTRIERWNQSARRTLWVLIHRLESREESSEESICGTKYKKAFVYWSLLSGMVNTNHNSECLWAGIADIGRYCLVVKNDTVHEIAVSWCMYNVFVVK